jgi:hypothetical protein
VPLFEPDHDRIREQKLQFDTPEHGVRRLNASEYRSRSASRSKRVSKTGTMHAPGPLSKRVSHSRMADVFTDDTAIGDQTPAHDNPRAPAGPAHHRRGYSQPAALNNTGAQTTTHNDVHIDVEPVQESVANTETETEPKPALVPQPQPEPEQLPQRGGIGARMVRRAVHVQMPEYREASKPMEHDSSVDHIRSGRKHHRRTGSGNSTLSSNSGASQHSYSNQTVGSSSSARDDFDADDDGQLLQSRAEVCAKVDTFVEAVYSDGAQSLFAKRTPQKLARAVPRHARYKLKAALESNYATLKHAIVRLSNIGADLPPRDKARLGSLLHDLSEHLNDLLQVVSSSSFAGVPTDVDAASQAEAVVQRASQLIAASPDVLFVLAGDRLAARVILSHLRTVECLTDLVVIDDDVHAVVRELLNDASHISATTAAQLSRVFFRKGGSFVRASLEVFPSFTDKVKECVAAESTWVKAVCNDLRSVQQIADVTRVAMKRTSVHQSYSDLSQALLHAPTAGVSDKQRNVVYHTMNMCRNFHVMTSKTVAGFKELGVTGAKAAAAAEDDTKTSSSTSTDSATSSLFRMRTDSLGTLSTEHQQRIGELRNGIGLLSTSRVDKQQLSQQQQPSSNLNAKTAAAAAPPTASEPTDAPKSTCCIVQ